MIDTMCFVLKNMNVAVINESQKRSINLESTLEEVATTLQLSYPLADL